MADDRPMMEERTWDELREAGLLWWVNTQLHLFGYAIAVELEAGTERVLRAVPVRTRFRGFSSEVDAEGYAKVSAHLEAHAKALAEEARE